MFRPIIKKSYIKSRDSRTREKDPPWFTKEIEDGIKERRRINRLRRNAETGEERQLYWNRYVEQKKKVAELVKSSLSKYEEKLTKEIRENKDTKKNGNA